MIKTTLSCDNCGVIEDSDLQYCGYCNTKLYVEKAILLAEHLAKQERMKVGIDQIIAERERLFHVIYQVAQGFFEVESENEPIKNLGKRLFDAVDKICGEPKSQGYVTKKVAKEVDTFYKENPNLV